MNAELLERARNAGSRAELTVGSSEYSLITGLEAKDRQLRRLCEQRLSDAAGGAALSPADSWLIDNYSYLHSHLRTIRDALPKSYYRYLPRFKTGNGKSHPRIYELACDLVAATGGVLTLEVMREYFSACQATWPLTIAELWAIASMLQVGLLEAIYQAASVEGREAEREGAVRNAIESLRLLENAGGWREVVQSISIVDQLLAQDPAGVYSRMDFESRDAYRQKIEKIARASGCKEHTLARCAIDLAADAKAASCGDDRRTHVGFYLIGPGLGMLLKRARARLSLAAALQQRLYRWPNLFYVGGITVLTAALLAAIRMILSGAPWWYLALAVLPASHVAVFVMNLVVTLVIPPRQLPRLDFSEGIPDDARTFVVIPTLLLSRAGIESLLEKIEIHFLANRDPNLLFGLLTDFPDSPTPTSAQDELLELCAEGIRVLNERYAADQGSPFYLFHRGRQWNPSESVWMGRERKRGKLNDFNALLLGEDDAFETKLGDLSVLPTVRYVITLDTDTQLPRDTAAKLVGNMAHPLNWPIIDSKTALVREGYAILQPRVSISMESAARSRLARIYSGQTGFDPYTTAVSDVYQDLFGRATFTGKGIYDLRAFHAALKGRFPDNALLSHDLIEGEHARCGLVSDQEVVDDYPATYQAYCKRRHRWVRGDWQIAMWMLPRVPDALWHWGRNPLPLVARWKIFDNLRRSLTDPAFLLLLLSGWLLLREQALRATLIACALVLLPYWAEVAAAFLRLPPRRVWAPYFREVFFRFARSHVDAVLYVVFLAHQSALMVDAAVRTMMRRAITHRHLLEWESMAQAEASAGRLSLMDLYLYACPVAVLASVPLLCHSGTSLVLWIAEMWIFSPLIALWLNGKPSRRRASQEDDTEFLRDAALRTWRYFADHGGESEHWLVPDNIRLDPANVDCRTSPTNIGLQLTANLCAHDLGYLTAHELIERTKRTLSTLASLETYRGHLFNWYNTQTLSVLDPRYVSTVDSGNLAASLITLRQGLIELERQAVVGPAMLAGLRDHVRRLRNTLPANARSAVTMRLLDSLLKQLAYQPSDLFFWEGVLGEARSVAARLHEHIVWEASRLESLEQPEGAELRYWSNLLLDRLDQALAYLYGVAPWLAQPYEPELRMNSSEAGMSDLMRELCRVPTIAELPVYYSGIREKIDHRLTAGPPLHIALRDALEQLKGELESATARAQGLVETLDRQAAKLARYVDEMDFSFLYDARRKLFRIGYNSAAARLDESSYDLLASEARTAVFVAIAKGDIPREAWFRLGRKLTAFRGHRTLLSWSGTMFEYLMPALFMRNWDTTLLAESCVAAVRIQQLYGRERNIPWGISEAACSTLDSSLNYQYYAFGVPSLSMKGRQPENLVIAPYASALALLVDRVAAVENLRDIASNDWTGRYGFFESIDFRKGWALTCHDTTPVRAHMVHHQAMALMAFTNTLLDQALPRRFHAEPMVQATEYLLQERLPVLAEVTPELAPLRAEAAAVMPLSDAQNAAP